MQADPGHLPGVPMFRRILDTAPILAALAVAICSAPAWAVCETGAQTARTSCLMLYVNKLLVMQSATDAAVAELQSNLTIETARADALEDQLVDAEARLLLAEADLSDVQVRLDAHDVDLDALVASSVAVDATLAVMEVQLAKLGDTVDAIGDPFTGVSSTVGGTE